MTYRHEFQNILSLWDCQGGGVGGYYEHSADTVIKYIADSVEKSIGKHRSWPGVLSHT